MSCVDPSFLCLAHVNVEVTKYVDSSVMCFLSINAFGVVANANKMYMLLKRTLFVVESTFLHQLILHYIYILNSSNFY